MTKRFQKAMYIAWLFLLLIEVGCTKKKYTYFFDRYQTSPKNDTVIVEEPPIIYASADSTFVPIVVE
ncbi:MAG: hypothetical protein WDO15_03165 [Bacteroidota bacterium]